LETGVRLLG